MPMHRRLVAVVAADVAGYSRLMERDEAGTHQRLRTLREALLDPKIAEHGGRTVKTAGDGMLLEFPSATSALRCAVEVQRELGVRNLYIAADEKLELRIGINLGDIIVDGEDIAGDGVNVAARLETLAEPGGICAASIAKGPHRRPRPSQLLLPRSPSANGCCDPSSRHFSPVDRPATHSPCRAPPGTRESAALCSSPAAHRCR
jgi:hypothetical protein